MSEAIASGSATAAAAIGGGRVGRPRRSRIARIASGEWSDKRPDCVQVVIALIVTPDGFPLAYEVMKRNTPDNTTRGAGS